MEQDSKRTPETQKDDQTFNLMHARVSADRYDNMRAQMAAARSVQEEAGSSGVSDTREADCPAAIRVCTTLFGVLFAICLVLCIVLWYLETFAEISLPNLFGLSASLREQVLRILTVVCLGLFGLFCGLKAGFQRRAWIQRMRQQDAEKQKKSK